MTTSLRQRGKAGLDHLALGSGTYFLGRLSHSLSFLHHLQCYLYQT